VPASRRRPDRRADAERTAGPGRLDPRVYRRRRLAAAATLAAVSLAAGVAVSAGDERGGDEKRAPGEARGEAKRAAELPGGGRRLFPDRRVVALYGHPRDPELGALGIGSPPQAARRLRARARAYDRKSRPVLPAMELIAVLATAAPGADGLHRDRTPAETIDRYLRAARRSGALLILDIQPGRAPFGPEIERLERWLREPDVGLALDPEWHVEDGQVPGRVIGSVDADAVNAAAAWLSRIVRERDLPEKLLLVHRFTDAMIRRDERLREFPGVRTVVNIDGFGDRAVKVAKYDALVARTPRLPRGIKLFLKEDTGLMTPAQTLALRPPPDVVIYE